MNASNCYKTIGRRYQTGKVILVEFILTKEIRNNVECMNVATSDIFMLATLPGAKERKLAELTQIAQGAGFRNIKDIPIDGTIRVVELCK